MHGINNGHPKFIYNRCKFQNNICSSDCLGLTLVNFQLDAQNTYLFIHNTFIKIPYMFRALSCSSSAGLLRNCIYVASGIVTVCR